jgi:hypothetical protein
MVPTNIFDYFDFINILAFFGFCVFLFKDIRSGLIFLEDGWLRVLIFYFYELASDLFIF